MNERQQFRVHVLGDNNHSFISYLIEMEIVFIKIEINNFLTDTDKMRQRIIRCKERNFF